MKTFVLHYSKLVDRKKSILSQFKKEKITNFEFVESFDKSEIKEIYEKRFSKIPISCASINLKHEYAYQIIADNYHEALIFEDDAILAEDFIEKLNSYMDQLPKDYDLFFIGNGCDLHIESHIIQHNKFVYPKRNEPTSWGGMGSSRCTDSYIVSNKCSIVLAEYISNLKPIDLPSDWLLNKAAVDLNLKVYWAEPTIVTQGSANKTFDISYDL